MRKALHQNISVDIVKIKKPSLDAQIIANNLTKKYKRNSNY